MRTSSSSSILFGRGDPTLESVVDVSNLALFCTPAINLFHKRADRIHVSDSAHEYHVVADRTRPLDFEIYEVTSVVGHGIGDRQRAAVPAVLLGLQQRSGASGVRLLHDAPRAAAGVTPTAKRRGSRSSYIGTRGLSRARRCGAGAVSAATCASCRFRRCAPIGISCCRCRSASGPATCRWTSPRR